MKKYIKASSTATISSIVQDPQEVRRNIEQILRDDLRDHARGSDELGLNQISLSDDMTIKFPATDESMPKLSVVTKFDGKNFTFEPSLTDFPNLDGYDDMLGIVEDWKVAAKVADYFAGLRIDPLNYSEYD